MLNIELTWNDEIKYKMIVISMCLVRRWRIGFWAKCLALMLSCKMMGMEAHTTWSLASNDLNYNSSEVLLAKSQYLDSVKLHETTFFLELFHETMFSPIKMQKELILHRSLDYQSNQHHHMPWVLGKSTWTCVIYTWTLRYLSNLLTTNQ